MPSYAAMHRQRQGRMQVNMDVNNTGLNIFLKKSAGKYFMFYYTSRLHSVFLMSSTQCKYTFWLLTRKLLRAPLNKL